MQVAALIAVLAAAPTALIAGALRPAWAGPAGALAAGVAAVALGWAWAQGGGVALDVPWDRALGARLSLALDGLGLTFAVLAAALAALVGAYASSYVREHLREAGRPAREQVRFHGLMLAFMAAMVLLVTARDLVVIFVALDLTALTSFFLIRFDRDRPEARRAAMVAVVMTAGSSTLFLVGALLLRHRTGTLSIDALARLAEADATTAAAAACIVAGVLAKSAQVPLHLWLPRAMVAPTPVSAYLHSAAMVAAGVFVLMRLRFVLALAPAVLDVVLWIGLASIALGSLLALVDDELKKLLAHSTIAQYGYVLVLIAAGGEAGTAGAPLYVFVHGLCKCALFLAAGAVTQATGADRLSAAGGVLRRMPWLAAASGVAAAGLAGLPLTAGFWKDELLFGAAATHGAALSAAAALAAALTLAYTARFWLGLFAGPARAGGGRPPASQVAPVVALAAAVLAGGVVAAPLEALARDAGAVVRGAPAPVELAYHLDARVESLLALAAWAGGLAILLSRRVWEAPLARLLALRVPERLAAALAHALVRLSDRLHAIEVRDLRDRVGGVLLPAAVVTVAGLIAAPGTPPWQVGGVAAEDVPVALAMAITAAGAVLAARLTGHLALILMMSVAGFGLGLVFVFSAAPDVALVAVLVETTFTLLFLVVMSRLPAPVRRRAREESFRSRGRDLVMAIAGGAVATVICLTALSRRAVDSVGEAHARLAGDAHAGDVVTAVLADFRGLDTAGEITVLTLAMLGAAALRSRLA